MTAPIFPLVGVTQPVPPSIAESNDVTLALTLNADPDNPVPGDLHLLNGQIHFWDGFEARYQKTLVLLRFVRGEWFLNTEEGIPYFEQVLVHNPNSKAIVTLFRKALLASPSAKEAQVNITRDRANRTALITFQLTFDDGQVLRSSDFPPFILQVPS